jgi:hypothetical protein
MEEQAEPTAEREQGGGLWGYVFRAGAVLLVYLLSSGPVVMMEEKVPPNVEALLNYLYYPVGRLYLKTPLQKPLGMYLHLWCPRMYDKSGDLILY